MLDRQNLKILECYQKIKGAMAEREKNTMISVRCDRLAGRLVVKEIILLLQHCEAQEDLSKEVREKLVTLEAYVETHLAVVQNRFINPEILWSLISPGVGLVEELVEAMSNEIEGFPRPLATGSR